MSANHPPSRDRQGKTAALVVAVAGVLWLGMQWLGAELGIPVRYMFLIDLMAMAAMLWAILVGLRLWRGRADKT